MSKNSLAHKRFMAAQRRKRTRSRVHGSAERPRLSVNISNKHVSAQIINDDAGKTLAYATTVGAKTTGSLADRAAWVGAEIAKKAQKAKVKKVIFDRGEHQYSLRLQKLAEAARSGGLEF